MGGGRVQEFCACGASIDARCNLCSDGICLQCNAVAIGQEAPASAIATTNFGYVGDGYNAQIVVGLRLRLEEHFGPRLPISKLLWVVADAQGRSVHHVCLECLGHAVPEAADWITSGTVCHEPQCLLPSTQSCRRCGTVRCSVHSLSEPNWPGVDIGLTFDPSTLYSPADHVRVQAPVGLCGLCLHETLLSLSHICAQQYPHMHVRDQYFSIPVRRRASERRRRQERLNSLALAELYASEWGERWNELASTPSPERAAPFAEGRCYFTVENGYVSLPDNMELRTISDVWTILDDRDSMLAAACHSAVA